jgi:serine protease Do
MLKSLLLLIIGGLFGFFGLSLERYLHGSGFSLRETLSVAGTSAPTSTEPTKLTEPTAPSQAPTSPSRDATTHALYEGRRNAVVQVAETVSPAIVSITVKRSEVVAYRDPFFEFFGPEYRKREFSGLGSGVIVSDKGFIMTNAHVVGLTAQGEQGQIEELTVTLPDGRRFPAQLIGGDGDIDLAVLRIEGKNLPVAPLQEKADNLIGEWVVAIGNPYGYLIGDTKPTVTVGVISAVGRTFSSQSGIHYHNMIQTDASINPGNSGGALVNTEGKVIGINSFIFTGGGQTQGSIGLGFALPIQKAKLVMDELIRFGYIRQFTTGLYTDPYAEIPVPGMLITQIERGSPADKAGLRKGDIIVRTAGRAIRNFRDLQDIFKLFQVGESVEVEFNRGGKIFSTKMVLEEARRKGKVY